MSERPADDDGATTDRYHIDDVAVIGRTFEEYRAMFDLSPSALTGRRVLDCPAGVCSFVAEARDRGVDAVGIDPAYGQSVEGLREAAREDVDRTMAALDGVEHLYRWDRYGDVGGLRAHRERARRRFFDDFVGGPYLAGALPNLPLADDSVDLLLSANFLFLYDDRFDHDFHRAALRECCRVASEVRVFPLVGFDTERYDRLDDLIGWLRGRGHAVETRTVPYEFQRGADEMLVIGSRSG